MSNEITSLEPNELWKNFAALNAVPRPSKKEAKVIEFARQFGESLQLETIVDDIGNVIIRKPAHPAMQDRETVVIQSHLDMVCQKNADVDFDFETQGIEMYVDDDFVKAKGTTLGADNGIGVAAIMTLLASTEIEHPPLEALFTIDEETGMTGALGLQPNQLQGKILLNLDTEEDNELTIGCAGGTDVILKANYAKSHTPSGTPWFNLSVRGLKGGHSGMDIHLGRANANKWMNRLLWHAAQVVELSIGRIDGGGLRNAIPRESFASVAIGTDDVAEFKSAIEVQTRQLLDEYRTTDPNATIEIEEVANPELNEVMSNETQKSLLAAVYACANGVYRLSPDIPDLVQTSNNLARVLVENGKIEIDCLTRSSVNSERDDLANSIANGFASLNGEVTFSGKYPGWAPKPDSGIVKIMSELYLELFGESAHVAACHAGLECGIIGQNYDDLDMVSFGPNIFGAHSPDERVQISSVQKFWKYLLAALKKIPAK